MPPKAPSRTTHAFLGLWLTLAVAAGARLAYWLEVRRLSLFQEATGDAATNVLFAEALKRDGPMAPLGEPYTQAPLYSWLLWLAGTVGLDLDHVRIVQLATGVVLAGMVWAITRRAAGPAAAAVAGVMAGLYGPLIFFEGELLSISVAVLLLTFGMAMWGKPRAAWSVGLAWGAAALAQPNLLLAALLPLGLAVARPRPLGWPSRGSAATAAAFLFLPIVVVGARNLAVSGEYIPISTNGGINFFIGNNDKADGTFHLPPDARLLNRPEGLFTSAREAAEAREGRPLSAAAVDRHWMLRGVDFWLADPGRATGLFARKMLLVLNAYEIPNHYDYDYFRGRSFALRVAPTLAWLLPLAFPGLFLLYRRGHRLPAIYTAGVLLAVGLFFVTARYRLPIVVGLFPAAGAAAAHFWSDRARLARNVPLLAAAVLGVIIAVVPLGTAVATDAHMSNLEGVAAYSRGDLAAAEDAFRRAVAAEPRHAEALNNLGRVLAMRGDDAAAAELYRRAMAADPMQSETYFNLEEFHRRQGRLDEASAALDRLLAARGGIAADVAPSVAGRRGLIALAAGDTAAALEELGAAVRLDDQNAAAWTALAEIALARGLVREAFQAGQQAARAAPGYHPGQLAYGKAVEAGRRYEDAIRVYEIARGLKPDDPETLYRLGRVHRLLGRAEAAEQFYRQSAEGAAYGPALAELGMLYERLARIDDARAVYRALRDADAAEPAYRAYAVRRLNTLGDRDGDPR